MRNRKLRLTATSKLNIALHLIPTFGFAYFAWKAGDSYFGGFMAACSLFILVDMVACIKSRIKGEANGDTSL